MWEIDPNKHKLGSDTLKSRLYKCMVKVNIICIYIYIYIAYPLSPCFKYTHKVYFIVLITICYHFVYIYRFHYYYYFLYQQLVYSIVKMINNPVKWTERNPTDWKLVIKNTRERDNGGVLPAQAYTNKYPCRQGHHLMGKILGRMRSALRHGGYPNHGQWGEWRYYPTLFEGANW